MLFIYIIGMILIVLAFSLFISMLPFIIGGMVWAATGSFWIGFIVTMTIGYFMSDKC